MPENPAAPSRPDGIEMPRPTPAPMILAAGVALLGAGVALGLSLSVVGVVVLIAGLAGWVGDLRPGRGHLREERAEPERRPQAITGAPGTVAQMQAGMPGYRMRLPLKVHPISAGIKGGLVGGVVMPIPALVWSVLTGHGIWFPINLLAGMGIPRVQDMSVSELEGFQQSLFLGATFIHFCISVVIGLLYGVLLPMLPRVLGSQFIWGAVVIPLLWTGAAHGLMGLLNPLLEQHVHWPAFIASQFVFGFAASLVVICTETISVPPAGMGPDTESLTR